VLAVSCDGLFVLSTGHMLLGMSLKN